MKTPFLEPDESVNEETRRVGGLKPPSAELRALEGASTAWIERGDVKPIDRWFGRSLDPEGVPLSLPLGEWISALTFLADSIWKRSEGWPERLDALIEGWFRALLRFSRSNGTQAFGPNDTVKDRAAFFRFWADRLSLFELGAVVDRWFPHPGRDHYVAPPLPADSRPDRPFAILRANWVRDGDFLAVDHRELGEETRFELFGMGRTWLGPTWSSGVEGERITKAIPTFWSTQSTADILEWSFRVGRATITRTAIYLRGRRLAILGECWDGPNDPGTMLLKLPAWIASSPIDESRGISLSLSRPKISAKVFPIGLPKLPYETERGSLTVEDGKLVLHQPTPEGLKRSWRGVVVSWEQQRNRPKVRWRSLTVTEQSRRCDASEAFAARITWGRDDTLVVYRALGDPGLRAFLGHQTRARLVVALFSATGEIEPLLKVDA